MLILHLLLKVEAEAKAKTEYLLKRAFDLKQEQEDEVKKANQLILASKCLAIRAAQVQEKEVSVLTFTIMNDKKLFNILQPHYIYKKLLKLLNPKAN